jgi:hypothetical protein
MPFGLKNVGVTFAWLVKKVLRGQFGRNIEAYVNDVIVKTKEQ